MGVVAPEEKEYIHLHVCVFVCVCVFLFNGRCWNQLALYYQFGECVVTLIFREISLNVRQPRREGQNNVLC